MRRETDTAVPISLVCGNSSGGGSSSGRAAGSDRLVRVKKKTTTTSFYLFDPPNTDLGSRLFKYFCQVKQGAGFGIIVTFCFFVFFWCHAVSFRHRP